jgi:hypothetical protein
VLIARLRTGPLRPRNTLGPLIGSGAFRSHNSMVGSVATAVTSHRPCAVKTSDTQIGPLWCTTYGPQHMVHNIWGTTYLVDDEVERFHSQTKLGCSLGMAATHFPSELKMAPALGSSLSPRCAVR